MEKQVKFSMEEVNKIVGQYVFDKDLLGDVDNVDILFVQRDKPEDSYIVVSKR